MWLCQWSTAVDQTPHVPVHGATSSHCFCGAGISRAAQLGGRGSESHEVAAKMPPGPRHRKACLWPEHPCFNGSLAWSSAGGLSSEPSPGPLVGPFAAPHDVVPSSILRIFQPLSKHVLRESEITEGDMVPFKSYCRMSHTGISATSSSLEASRCVQPTLRLCPARHKFPLRGRGIVQTALGSRNRAWAGEERDQICILITSLGDCVGVKRK